MRALGEVKYINNLTVTISDPVAAASPSTPSAVPEPQAWVLAIAGLGAVGAALRARKRKTAVAAGS